MRQPADRAELPRQDGIAAIKSQARATALEHRNKVLAMPMPDPATVEDGVYAD